MRPKPSGTFPEGFFRAQTSGEQPKGWYER